MKPFDFRNGSVLADLTIVYRQSVEPKQFAVIFKALYEDGKLGNLTVQPVKDNGTRQTLQSQYVLVSSFLLSSKLVFVN